MTMLSLRETADAVNGTLVAADPAIAFARVTHDSRDVRMGDLFIAIVGERFDGHDFVPQAQAQGAVAALVQKGRKLANWFDLIEVDDTVVALGQLAAYWRQRFSASIVAITGSNGKTSLKEMLATILRRAAGSEAVLATVGNLNNHLGVPLMMLRMTEAHRYIVLEMGMNHFGEIAYLTHLAQPNVALINNAGAGHLEFLGSVEGVARAKGEIFAGLPANGTAIINADDMFANYWRGLAGTHRVLSFGLGLAADADTVSATEVRIEPLSSRFDLLAPRGAAPVHLMVPGLHNIRNALGAAAAACALGFDADTIAQGLSAYGGTRGRLQQNRALNGAVVIDDTYNANPNSMRAAIDVLAAQHAPRFLVLGDMGEVGANSDSSHTELGAYARAAGIEYFYAVGAQMQRAVGRLAQAHAGSTAIPPWGPR